MRTRVGRKIGFTNRGIWAKYGVYEPIWGTVYDDTLIVAEDGKARVSLDGLSHPRIEPEICFKLSSSAAIAAWLIAGIKSVINASSIFIIGQRIGDPYF